MSTLEQDRVTATDTVETAETEASRPLSGLDRCDSCGAQAYVRAVLGGTELLFCAHHARAHLPKLADVASEIVDESDRLHDDTSA